MKSFNILQSLLTLKAELNPGGLILVASDSSNSAQFKKATLEYLSL